MVPIAQQLLLASELVPSFGVCHAVSDFRGSLPLISQQVCTPGHCFTLGGIGYIHKRVTTRKSSI